MRTLEKTLPCPYCGAQMTVRLRPYNTSLFEKGALSLIHDDPICNKARSHDAFVTLMDSNVDALLAFIRRHDDDSSIN